MIELGESRCGRPALAKLIQCAHTTGLASLPSAVERLGQLLDYPLSTQTDLARVVRLDPALSLMLLRRINGRDRSVPVTTVAHAVTQVGQAGIRSLQRSAVPLVAFPAIPGTLIDGERYWLHSLATAVLAETLAARIGYAAVEPWFLAGLLATVGRMTFCLYQADSYGLLLAEFADVGATALSAAERRVYGFDQARLASELLRAARLPRPLWHAVLFQDNPAQAHPFAREAALLHVSKALAEVVEPGFGLPQAVAASSPHCDAGACRLLGLPSATLSRLVDAAIAVLFQQIRTARPAPL